MIDGYDVRDAANTLAEAIKYMADRNLEAAKITRETAEETRIFMGNMMKQVSGEDEDE